MVEAQREFFDFGPQAIKPLPMTKVAEQLGIHVATVSRAVADKYLQTPRGIVALRKFFTGGTVTDEGEEVSWDAIKAALSDVIEKKTRKTPSLTTNSPTNSRSAAWKSPAAPWRSIAASSASPRDGCARRTDRASLTNHRVCGVRSRCPSRSSTPELRRFRSPP